MKKIFLLLVILTISIVASGQKIKFTVTIHQGTDISHVFYLANKEAIEFEPGDGKLWRASYSEGSFFYDCYYVDYGTFDVKAHGNGTFNMLGNWQMTPVTIKVENFVDIPELESPINLYGSSGNRFSYTPHVIKGGSTITYSVHVDGINDGLYPLPSYLSLAGNEISGMLPAAPPEYSFYFDIKAANYCGSNVARVNVQVGPVNITCVRRNVAISAEKEDDPNNCKLFNCEVVKLVLSVNKNEAGGGAVIFTIPDSCEVYSSPNCTPATKLDNSLHFNLAGSGSGSSALAGLANGSATLYAKFSYDLQKAPMGTTATAILKRDDIPDSVSFKKCGVEIIGYKKIGTGQVSASDIKDANAATYIVKEPFQMDLKTYGLGNIGDVSFLFTSNEPRGVPVKAYLDSSLTQPLVGNSGTVNLANPGNSQLAGLVGGGTVKLYMEVLTTSRYVSQARLSYSYVADGTSTSDFANFQTRFKGPNITGFRPKGNDYAEVDENELPVDDTDDDLTGPDPEEDPYNLVIMACQDACKWPDKNIYSAKAELRKRSAAKGKITLKISPENAVKVFYGGHELPNKGDNWVCDMTNNKGGLLALKNGTVELYFKAINPCDSVTVELAYDNPSYPSASVDTLRFKILDFCSCGVCIAGGSDFKQGSVNGEINLAVNNFGQPAGKIIYHVKDLNMNCASPDSLQILPGPNTTVSYSDGRPLQIDTGINHVNFTYQATSYNNVEYVWKTTMNFCTADSTTPFRTIILTNNYTYGGLDESGKPIFTINSFTCTNEFGGVTKTATFTKNSAGNLIFNDNGVEKSMKVETTGDVTTKTFYTGSQTNPVSVRIEQYKTFPWATEMISLTDSGETTSYVYYDNPGSDGLAYGKVKQITYPKGKVVSYTYDANGDLHYTDTQEGGNTFWDSVEISDIISINGGTPEFYLRGGTSYNPPLNAIVSTIGIKQVRTRSCNNTLISKNATITWYDYSNPDQNIAYDQNNIAYTNLTYKIAKNPAPQAENLFLGRVRLVKNYNGIVTTYNYFRETDNGVTYEFTVECTGKPDDFDDDDCSVIEGVKTITKTKLSGTVKSRITQDIVSGKILSSETAEDFDAFDRATETHYLGGAVRMVAYGCCGPTSETDNEGIVTTSAYDTGHSRLSYTTRDGITTFYTYNANGDITSTTIKGRNNAELTTSNTYVNGRLASSTDPLGHITTYAYGSTADTTTFPDDSTSIVTYNQGVQSKQSGTAAHELTYSYGPNWSRVVPANITTYIDMLGRQYRTIYPGNNSSTIYYNDKGQNIKQITPGGMRILAEYDDLGRLIKSAIDMNKNSIIENQKSTIDSADIVSENQYGYSTYGGKDVSVKTSVVSQGTQSKTVSIEYASLDGLDSWTVSDGRVNHTNTVYPSPRDGSKTVTTTRFDGSKTISYFLNGRITRSENFYTDSQGSTVAGNTVDYAYDEFNRQISVTEKYNGTVINTTETAYNANNQPISVTENGRATTYVYDSRGRRTSTTINPTQNNPGRTINYEYFPTGELKKTYGADTYTQAFTYNDFGNMASLTTYKNTSVSQMTAWTYNSRNFMTAKTYPDGKSINYDYDGDGRLLSRSWARGITTSYSYDNAGRRIGIAYDDNLTPAIGFSYDFLNRVTAVSDGTGSRTFTYNSDSTLAGETIPHIVNGTLEYDYDSLGRRAEMQLKQNSTAVFTNTYGYDVQNRIATVSDGANTATYSRVAGTNLLNTTTITSGGSTKLTTTRNYDSLHRMTGISSVAGAVTKSYSYTYDDNDRRSRLNMPDGSYWLYTYDDKGQIKSGVKHDSAGKIIPGQTFGYAYDGIGNLTNEQRGIADMSISYASNILNQYTSRTFPGVVPIVGEADIDATVKAMRTDISNSTAELTIAPVRNGRYFTGAFHGVNNTAASRNVTYDIYAIKDEANQQLINKQSGSFLVPKRNQKFSYDDDGDMTGDGSWSYTWNGENQLIKAEKANSQKLEFAYDYMGRRTEKKVYSRVNGVWSLVSTEKYVYNGWNLIAVLDGTGVTLKKTLLWGIDLSGSMQGAGGVGGLLAESSNSTSYYPVYDGNGNVCAYCDTTGTLVAEYNYGPFGQINSKTGSLADSFSFRFSTKSLDQELNSYDFGKRIYDVDIMRWLNQDPIEERDSPNLYGFVKNNPISRFDVLGMWGEDVHNGMTSSWAVSINYPSEAANAIGAADEAVDSGATGPIPIIGDQSYHFNRPWGAGDSRIRHSNEHFTEAKKACADHSYGTPWSSSDDPDYAVKQLGLSLHPLQDYYAHGDFGKNLHTADIYVWHNMGSPQRLAWYGWMIDNPANYPDNPNLDADGTDGRPSGNALEYTRITGEYAIFHSGSQRITATQRVTEKELKEFQQYLKTQKTCCRCFKYFGISK